MAEVIQFNCPACGTKLRLPLVMAAGRGPCPNCDREIIAPDPYLQIGAFVAPIPPPPILPEPFIPFAEIPPARQTEALVMAEIPSTPAPATVRAAPLCDKPQRAILVLSCLLTGAVALATGFALGVGSNRYFMRIPASTVTVVPTQLDKPSAPVPTIKPEPVPIRVKPIIETPKIEKAPEPTGQVSAAAQASLQAFLEAPDWASRSAYVLYPEKMRGAMEAYSREIPDGPTPYKSITVKQSQIDEKTGNTLFIFLVGTEKFPSGIPVAIQETPGGWLVDWLAFVEFRDGLFQKFVDGPADQTGRFHLIVAKPPEDRAANTENEYFSSFLLQSPLAANSQLAFVRKSSEAHNQLQAQTSSGDIFAPVLEVVKRLTPEGKSYFEITRIIATDWFPRER